MRIDYEALSSSRNRSRIFHAASSWGREPMVRYMEVEPRSEQSHWPVHHDLRAHMGYHFDFGAVSFDIGDDGKDYPTVPTRSTSLKVIGEREWFRVHKIDGKEVDHSTLTITPDGQTLLVHTVWTDIHGKTHESDETEKRVGDRTGLAGTWRSTTAGINVPKTIVIDDAGKGGIRRQFPDEGQLLPCRRSANSYKGSRSVPGVTVALRTISVTRCGGPNS